MDTLCPRALVKGKSIVDLAAQLGIDGKILAETIERFNRDARHGQDTEFGRGNSKYNCYVGDRDHKPNPCIAPVEKGPFYALQLHTGDIGTALGLRANTNAQVLDGKDKPIEGLYVCGNDMNSIFAGTYATGGVTLGPALTFGYIIANHMVSLRGQGYKCPSAAA
ncbi:MULTISPECIES: FAD-binding protein [unclassified Chelatococcus]|uniref:FAD-binding protein n=1 Tax=unclassified Chelatococcus TaxID=2638111 RepID=UPI001BCBA0B5|nr:MULTISPECIES: FAD-binding protein [unclassified Chelatococcus]MBS7743497.1 FAD-binding protein [Chelatococcus sp. HY11]MBX3547018.1 FAD-binding protein [Chelatococcus sp.]